MIGSKIEFVSKGRVVTSIYRILQPQIWLIALILQHFLLVLLYSAAKDNSLSIASSASVSGTDNVTSEKIMHEMHPNRSLSLPIYRVQRYESFHDGITLKSIPYHVLIYVFATTAFAAFSCSLPPFPSGSSGIIPASHVFETISASALVLLTRSCSAYIFFMSTTKTFMGLVSASHYTDTVHKKIYYFRVQHMKQILPGCPHCSL